MNDILPESLRNTTWAKDAEWSGVGKGWWPLLEEIHTALMEIDPNYQVLQFKEKFGTLRVYFSSDKHDECDKVVTKIEAKSASICEVCGDPGTHRRPLGWILTLCDKHYEDQVKRRMEAL